MYDVPASIWRDQRKKFSITPRPEEVVNNRYIKLYNIIHAIRHKDNAHSVAKRDATVDRRSRGVKTTTGTFRNYYYYYYILYYTRTVTSATCSIIIVYRVSSSAALFYSPSPYKSPSETITFILYVYLYIIQYYIMYACVWV